MKFVLEAKGLEMDACTRQYVRSMLLFSIWHHARRFDVVHVLLEGTRDGEDYLDVRCSIRAESSGAGAVSSSATGPDIAAAVQEALDRLEVAFWSPGRAEPERLAA